MLCMMAINVKMFDTNSFMELKLCASSDQLFMLESHALLLKYCTEIFYVLVEKWYIATW